MSGVSIVVVTWNSAELVDACLEAARKYSTDVVVVDNASSDGTAERVWRYRDVHLIANPTNRGFAAAVNQGVAATENELVLLVNPDVTLETEIEPLARACREPDVGAAGGRLVNEDGSDQAGFMVRRFPTAGTLCFEALGCNRVWPGNPVNRRYRCLDMVWDTERDVDQPAGALLMFRRECWRQLGGFDEGFYPVWFEDVDFLYRARGMGWRARYVPETVGKHRGGHSAKQLDLRDRTAYWYDSFLRYTSKHCSRTGQVMVCASVVFGSLARLPLSFLRERSAEPLTAYFSVMRLAAGWLLRGPREVSARRQEAGTTGADRVTVRIPE